jgi:predicted ATPase/DNA-binding SARP family transcriptional activator
VEFRILGSLEVEDDGQVVDLGGPRERILLARLLLSANRAVSADRLAEDLWSGEPPAHWLPTLRVYISRLRRALGPRAGTVVTEPPGYRLSMAADQLDAARFEELAAAARHHASQGRPEAAAAALRQALDLWRGPALSDVADLPFAKADIARLEEARLNAIEDRVEAELACGRHASLTAELEGLVATYPLHERFWGQRMRALYRSDRQADALRTYQELRAYLKEELGLEPSATLRELELAILRQDPGLDWRPPPRAGGHPAAGPLPPGPPRPGTQAQDPGRPLPADDVAARLAAETSSFIGREAELAIIGEHLARSRLLTLTGPSGSGKTRLAIHAGAQASARHRSGVWLVDLAPTGGPELVAPAVAAALSIREEPGRPLIDSIASRLRDSDALLIVDNCEHVVDAAAQIIATLLAACPSLRVLATSQTRLGVPGEATWPVPPLSIPTPAARDPDVVGEAESVWLLCDRAALARPGFALTSENAGHVAEVCRRLDGIPLAIELAAARLNALTPAQMAARLDNRFQLLTGGSRADLPRHRTLRAAIDWSHDLLDKPEQVCFRRMAVFAGGCTLDAVEAVCADATLPLERVFEAVTSLVDRSLLTTEERCGSIRYGMLESIHQYAREQLDQAAEDGQLSSRHLAWLLELAGRADLDGADQSAWLDLLEADHDNFRSGLEWALTARQTEPALALAGALAPFWVVRGHIGQGRRWLDAAIGAATAQDNPRARATALDGAAQLASVHADYDAQWAYQHESLRIWQKLGDDARLAHCLADLGAVAHIRGEFPTARSLLNEALEAARHAADRRQIATALSGLGRLALHQDDLPEAIAYFEESMALFRQIGDLRRATVILGNLGVVARNQGEIDLARTRLEEHLANARKLGDRKLTGGALTNLGMVAIDVGDLDGSHLLHLEALRLAEQVGDRRLESVALTNLGLVAQARKDFSAARSFHRRSLQLAEALGERRSIAESLEELASVAAAGGDADLAASLFGASQALRASIGAPIPAPDLARYNQAVEKARQALGDDAYEAAWERGGSASMQQAIAVAHGSPSPAPWPPKPVRGAAESL